MDRPAGNPSPTPARLRTAWALTGVGAVGLLAGVLYLNTHAIGGRVESFAERRTYVQTKRKVHEALPIAAALGLGGLGLMVLGGRMRRG